MIFCCDFIKIFRLMLVCSLFALAMSSAHVSAATMGRPANQLGLIAWFTLDGADMVPNVRDRSGNGLHGVLYGQTATSTVLGKIGQALDFDGSDDRVQFSGPGITSNTVTFTAWIKGTPVAAYAGILYSRNDPESVGINYRDSTYELGYVWNDNAVETYSWSSGLLIPTDSWALVAVAIEPTKATAFVCAEGVCNSSVNAIAHDTQTLNDLFNIGQDTQAGNRIFDGAIDDVRIYSRTLSSQEIRQLYNSATAKFSTSRTPSNLQTGLVGHWTFDGADMTPNIRDKSGQGNHANLINQISTTTVIGKIGQALKFDGIDDDAQTTAQPTVARDNISFSTWIYWLGTSGSYVPMFNGNSAADGYGFIISNGACGAGNYIDVLLGGLDCGAFDSTTVMPSNRWVHLAVVRDGGNWTLYMDGEAIDTQNGSAPSTPTNRFNMNIDGYLDDTRIYERPLSAAEIKQLYTIGSPKIATSASAKTGSLSSGLVGHWTFDGADMTPNVRDKSGQGNHAYISGQSATTTVIGKMGQALYFDKVDDMVNAGSASSLDDIQNQGGGGMSVVFWIRPDSFGEGDSLGKVIGKNTAIVGGSWQVSLVNGTQCVGGAGPTVTSSILFSKSDGAGAHGASKCAADNTISLGEWSHFVVTWDGSGGGDNAGIHIYKNGTEVSYVTTAAGGASIGSDADLDLMIGNRPAGDRTFDGAIDEVRLYNRVLSADEAKQLYNLAR